MPMCRSVAICAQALAPPLGPAAMSSSSAAASPSPSASASGAAPSPSASASVGASIERPRSRSPRRLSSAVCMICSDRVTTRRDSWACALCTCVLHARCRQQWADTQRASGKTSVCCPGCRADREGCKRMLLGPYSHRAAGMVCYVCRLDIAPLTPYHRCARTSAQCTARWHADCARTHQIHRCPACMFTFQRALEERGALALRD